jgi:hypothetical protein
MHIWGLLRRCCPSSLKSRIIRGECKFTPFYNLRPTQELRGVAKIHAGPCLTAVGGRVGSGYGRPWSVTWSFHNVKPSGPSDKGHVA